MRRVYAPFLTLFILIVLVLLGSSSALAAPGGGNCPSGGTKTNTSDGSIFIAAGVEVCVKASNGNTGKMISTGETLAELIIRSGLLNNGGQVPNVSNYVIYGQATATPVPSEDVKPTPVPSPTFEQEVGPSPTIWVNDGTPPAIPDTAIGADDNDEDRNVAITFGGVIFLIALWMLADALVARRDGRR